MVRDRQLKWAWPLAGALALTLTSLISQNQNSFSDGKERNDKQKLDLGKITPPWHLPPIPRAVLQALHILSFILTLSPASPRRWPCLSQESCEGGWGAEVRGLPPDTQQEGLGWRAGRWGLG